MKDIWIQNYQNVEDVRLELHPGVNVIIGPTDSGKSAVIRGVRDWAYNALGHGHITGGAKKSVIEIDGVRRERSKTINRYSIGNEVFDAVGKGTVPEQVQEVTGIREVEFGEGISFRLHFAEQFDPEFMVGFKPSDNAKIVGSLSGIHAVFNALRDATSDHVRVRREVKDLERTVEEAKESVKDHAWVKPIAERVKKNALLLKALREAEMLIGKWGDLRTRLLQAAKNILKAQREENALEGLASIDLDAVEETRDRLRILKQLKDRLGTASGIQARALSASQALQAARDMDLSALEGDRTRLRTLRDLRIRRAMAQERVEMGSDAREKLHAAAGVDLGNLKGDKGRLDELKILSTCLGLRKHDLEVADNAVKISGNNERGARDAHVAAVDGMDLCPVTGRTMPEDCKEILKESD